MQISACLVILLLAGAALFTAGCAQGTAPVLPAPPLPVPPPDIPDLALNQSEVPACFSLTEQHMKSSNEIGQMAKDLGWQAGYAVTYTCPANGNEPTILLQSIAVYPPANMPGIVSKVYEQDRQSGYTYKELSFPSQGSAIHGFFGTAGRTQASGISPGTYLLSGGRNVPDTSAVSGSDVAEIIIYRGTIFEVLRMTGPGTNATILYDMVQKASAKIP